MPARTHPDPDGQAELALRSLGIWRRPWTRAALVLAVLLLVALLQPRSGLEWKFSHVLWDYEFGLIKRGLIGEVFGWLFDPITVAHFYFYWFSCGAILVLALVMAATVTALPAAASPVALIYLYATPMLLRHVVYDWGRFDVFG